MSNITLKQFDGATVLPKDDAILYDMIVGQNGIISGCDLTWTGSNQVHMDAGYGIIKGRVFAVTEDTLSVKLPASASSSYYGYVVIMLDLEDTENPISIASSVYQKSTGADFPQEENANFTNGTYCIVIGVYRATATGITSFTDVKEMVSGTYKAISDFADLASLKESGQIPDAFLIKKMMLTFSDKTVATSAWTEDATYEDYPYRAKITCAGIDANYVPYITFSLQDAVEGIISPIAQSISNGIYIYASEIPEEKITIPTIQCIRKVG